MSRKNKNGKRRNYTPKTYGRDFLTPTPIERAIQEANKPASPQAVAVSDRIACDDKCSYEYKRMPAAWLETDFSYQRKIDSARVDRIVNSFDPRLANEVRIPIPQIYQGADYRLWIDRYYIAAQRLADERIRYAYLTRIHIHSELLANRSSIRKNGFALLDS